ncbi:hypothetical protein BH10BAC4_BH10BAC4_09970 [soil metagenome]
MFNIEQRIAFPDNTLLRNQSKKAFLKEKFYGLVIGDGGRNFFVTKDIVLSC